jgi:hypothetical protein
MHGNVVPSFTSRSLEQMVETQNLAHQESVVKETASTMYIGKFLQLPVVHNLPLFTLCLAGADTVTPIPFIDITL